MDYSRLEPVYNLIKPTNKKELQRVLGVINYFRKLIQDLSKKLQPINNLLKDDVEFVWSAHFTKILEKIINKLRYDKVVLVFPDYKLPFTVETDASDAGLGAVLKQTHGIISFYSRGIRGNEVNYSTS
ncbi:hypothetical protein ACTFIW_013317 [Dictyostelium discoideum]